MLRPSFNVAPSVASSNLNCACMSTPTLAARVAELAAILDEDGYLADWQQVDDQTFVLREFNCAVHHVARRFQQACGSEIEFIQTVLPDATVERQHHILRGEIFCGYRIVVRQAGNP